ncbi:MAG: formylmethanofuran dehydrogenase subunit E family protein [Aphanocapsa sp. GSE-SYN-MK-11-07L]|nr:formylmethanofuran dehydrogenase subunit E family protein [Aphanocapsa sp. GSE-SYN-MK-11-07L]
MPPSENGRFRDVDWGRTAAHPNQLARQQNHTTETPDQWVDLGQRVHGGFGSYLALGIRIGLDAMHRLNATARTLDVTYYNGAIAPCPCVVDGIMIATTSTPGQNLLRVASTPSPEGTFGVAEIHDRTTGKILRYTIPDRAKLQLDTWNQVTSGRQRYDAVMRASEETLFSVKMIR